MVPIGNPPLKQPFTDDDGLPALWLQFFSQWANSFNSITATGTTAQRPNPAPFIGFMYFDTTLGRPIWAVSATAYVFATGTPA